MLATRWFRSLRRHRGVAALVIVLAAAVLVAGGVWIGRAVARDRAVARELAVAAERAGGSPLVRSRTGPLAFAERRERVGIAERAMALLPERDRTLLRLASEGLAASAIGARLSLSADSADPARRRALERFRKTFERVSRSRTTD